MARQGRLNFSDLGIEVGVIGQRARRVHTNIPGFGGGIRITTAQLALIYENGTSRQPPRPALLSATRDFDRRRWTAWSSRIGKATINAKTPARPYARRLMTAAARELRDLMRARVIGYPPPNESSWAGRKSRLLGIDTTGVLTKQLINAIGYRVGNSPARYKG